ncbi:MAG TPA: hypothetical protein VM096_02850 [Vicinamibacterales bacterium]|nr:hypothetical protein [Vicinamibacterales bacterium]
MRTRIVACVTLMAFIAAPLRAQDRTVETTALSSMAATLQPGAFVEIRLKDGTHFKGTFMQRLDDGVVVKPRTRIAVPARQVALADVESIDPAKQGMSPAKKVLIGIGVGFAALTVLAALALANGYD